MKRLLAACLLCLSAVAAAPADVDELSVLIQGPGEAPPGRQIEDYLKDLFSRQLEQRRTAYEGLKSQAECAAWQASRRAFFERQLGGFPERTPLNAKTVGRLEGQGYRIENVLFESRPGFHVTANLYLPTSKPPYPGVLIPCGHSHDGKASAGHQRMGILLARNGMAALCYDPIGQGERYQMLDFQRDHVRFDAAPHVPVPHPRVQYLCTVEHTALGLGGILLGSNIARDRIWDGMRAIDYLQARPDIRPDRIGCTGNSGGGTLTAYLMALDDRIAAAAPVCYLTTFRRIIDTNGPQDGEQNLFGQIAFGMDIPDYVLMRAPKPTLICAATRDSTFDIQGAWDLFRQARRFYGRLGAPDRVDLRESDAPHGFTIAQRDASARWMARWLLGRDEIVPEFQTLPDPLTDARMHELTRADWTQEQLYCTPQGQVRLMPGEVSLAALNTATENALRPRRESAWQALSESEKRTLVRQTLGLSQRPAEGKPSIRSVGTLQREGYAIEKLILNPEPGIALPGLAFVPAKPNGRVCLYLHGESLKTDSGPNGPIESLVRQGQLVLAAELRGIGETEAGHEKPNWARGKFGPDLQAMLLAYLVGRSYVGMRTGDVTAWAEALAGLPAAGAGPHSIELIAIGEAAIPALHAAALEPARFASVRLREMLRSWSEIVRDPDGQNQMVNVVHGALTHYDLPDLIALAGAKIVRVEEPVDVRGKPIASASP